MSKWVAIASLACASVALAQTETAPANPPAAAAPATPTAPLMGLLDSAGVGKPLRDAGISIFGHVEGSWTYDASSPPANVIAGRSFDFENESITLNQLYVAVQREVKVSPTSFDIGGRMDWMYGADARAIHSNGLFDNNGLPAKVGGPGGPENQFDLTQAYVDVALPVGNGLRIRAGKFVTLMGEETIDPTTTPLYSRGYLFNFAIPFTSTGVYATYAFNDQWAIDFGVTRGWNQSLEDNNDAIDGMARLSWHSADKKEDFYITGEFGPQNTGDNGDWRQTIDVIWDYHINDQVVVTLNGDYDHDDAFGGSQWYGLAGYVTWSLNDYVAINGRLEWFDDQDGFNGIGCSVYDATAGLLLTPFPHDPLGSNWKIRPEIRYDYAEHGVFDGGTDHSQFTAAIESYFTF